MTDPSLTSIDGSHVDVAIIGGGINGASAAQHLSAAGYRVLIVDQGDFANGATSRSSRLLHCGLRHLATGSNLWTTLLRPDRLARALGTVRADMIARDEIVRTIPGRVKPINFCLPIYADDSYAPWQMDVAFQMLRRLGPKQIPLDYRRYDLAKLAQVPVAPWLRDPEKLRSVAVFREYVFDWPERIALDALQDARRMGTLAFNYTKVVELNRLASSERWQLGLCRLGQDTEHLDQTRHDNKIQITADIVLNLAGAWVDQIISKTNTTLAPKCAGIKGIHIAVRLPEEFTDWGVFTYNSIGEPLYCLPMNGMHYIGLTRTPFEGDATNISATDGEIDWMIAESNRCFPKLSLSRTDILFSWAGVNPLTQDPEETLGSREIKIHDMAADGLPNMLTLTGGPIMTHRRVANRLLQAVSKRVSPSTTPQDLDFKLPNSDEEPNAARLVSNFASISKTEVERCAREEQPHGLADLMMRRLGLGWTQDQGLALARPVAEAAAPVLGWSQDRVEAEVVAYKAHLGATRRCPNK